MLNARLILLTLFLPLSFACIGYVTGMYLKEPALAVIYSLSGAILGFMIDYVCAFRKVFKILLHKVPLPLILSLLSWWIGRSISNNYIGILAGICGAIIGLWLNRIMVVSFRYYKIRKRILVLVYFFFSIGIIGLFFGIPVFNLFLGVLAGNYLSIRVTSFYRGNKEKIRKTFFRGSLFTSLTILFLSLLSSYIALFDIDHTNYLLSLIHVNEMDYNKLALFIVIGSVLLAVAEFAITMFTAQTMLSYWEHKRKRYLSL